MNNSDLSQRFFGSALTEEQAKSFFSETGCVPGRARQFPAELVTVMAGAPGEDCGSVCLKAGLVCREWAAVYAHAATQVLKISRMSALVDPVTACSGFFFP